VAAVNGQRSMVIGTAATNSSVELFVRDTGPGLSVEARAHLFDPFFSTKEHGLGMGLAIVRTLVEQNGGSIVAENIADGGAIFRLILPAAVQSPNIPGGLSVEREVLAPAARARVETSSGDRGQGCAHPGVRHPCHDR